MAGKGIGNGNRSIQTGQTSGEARNKLRKYVNTQMRMKHEIEAEMEWSGVGWSGGAVSRWALCQ